MTDRSEYAVLFDALSYLGKNACWATINAFLAECPMGSDDHIALASLRFLSPFRDHPKMTEWKPLLERYRIFLESQGVDTKKRLRGLI